MFQVNLKTLTEALRRAKTKAEMEANNDASQNEKEVYQKDMETFATVLNDILQTYLKGDNNNGKHPSQPMESLGEAASRGDHAVGNDQGLESTGNRVEEQEPATGEERPGVHVEPKRAAGRPKKG